jgi:hypothetical protein
MKYTNFQIGSWIKWMEFYYHKNIELEENMWIYISSSTYV